MSTPSATRPTVTLLPPKNTVSGPPIAPKTSTASALATQVYESIRGGATGYGTDEEHLFFAIDRQTSGSLDDIRRTYQHHYQRNFDADVLGDLSGLPRERAEQLLRGDQAGADATELYRAMAGGLTGIGADAPAIFRTLEGRSPEDLAAIAAKYQSARGQGLDLALRSELSGDAQTRALALLRGDRAEADAARLHEAMKGGWTGIGADQEEIDRTLEGRSAEERAELRAAYGRLYGGGEADLLASHLGEELSGPERDQALAAEQGDQAGADAARVRAAMKGGWTGIGADAGAIQDVFEGRSAAERRALIDRYESRYGRNAGGPGLAADLQGELTQNQLAKTRTLIQSGALSDAERIHFALEGLGADGAVVNGTLQGKTREEIQALRLDYGARYGRDLDGDIAGELYGREAFDAQQALRGLPETPEQALQRAEEARAYERGGYANAISRAVMDDLAPEKGQRLDADLARAKDIVLKAAIEERPLLPSEREEFETTLGYLGQDTESYRTAKDSVAEGAATVAATGASLAFVAGTGGAAAPGLVALGAAGTGGGARVVAKAAIGGASYNAKDGLVDAAVGATDGAMVVGGAPVGRALARTSLEATSRAVLKEAGVPSVTRGMAELAGRDLLERSAKLRVALGAVDGAGNGAAGGAAGGALQAGLREGTWDQGAGPGMARVGVGAGTGALWGAGTGAAIGAGAAARGHLPDLRDNAAAYQPAQQGDNHWRTVGTYEDMLTVNRALEPRPSMITLERPVGAQRVAVYGARTPQELQNIEAAVRRLDELNPGLGVPSEIHVRSELGEVTDAAGHPLGGIGGLGGDGQRLVIGRAQLSSADATAAIIDHEVGHNLDTQLGDLSTGKGAGLFGEGDCVSAYAKKNPREDFAETHRVLIRDWEKITGNPELYVNNSTDVGRKFGFILEEVYGVSEPTPRLAAPPGARVAPAPTKDLPTPSWRDVEPLAAELKQVELKLPRAEEQLKFQQDRLEQLRKANGDFTKPPYTNPGHHDPSSPAFRGGGSMTTALPRDAESVYGGALPEPAQKGKVWWGRSASGDWYRFAGNGADVHWNGSTGATGGGRALQQHEVPGTIRRQFELGSDIEASQLKVDALRRQKDELGLLHEYAALELDERRAAALLSIGRPIAEEVTRMRWSELLAAAKGAPEGAIQADAAALVAAMQGETP